MSINILDSMVINRISAGEVVESPFSIVKELIDNALDAGATKIIVEIKNGGIDSIIVKDNGKGKKRLRNIRRENFAGQCDAYGRIACT